MKRTLLTLTLTLLLSSSALADSQTSGDLDIIDLNFAGRPPITLSPQNCQPVPNDALFALVISWLF